MTAGRIDWRGERARAGSQTQASLADLARRAAWLESPGRGKGSHRLFQKAGLRSVTIPTKVNANLARSIISQLGGDDA